MKTKLFVLMLACIFSLVLPAQVIDVKGKLKNQSLNRANLRTDQGIDKGLDVIEGGVKDAVTGEGENDDDQSKKDESKEVESDEQLASDGKSGGQKKQDDPKLESYSKFDFIPGEKIIFFDDFSQDAVGDFPMLWNTNGSAEVVTTNLFPGNWMKFVMSECVWTDELLNLPENFTIEFDVIPTGGLEGDGMSGYGFRLMQAKNARAWDGGSAPGEGGFYFNVEYFGRPNYSTWLNKDDCQASKLSGHINEEQLKQKMNQKYHISVWVQKSRVRLYQNENKIIDLPKAFPTGCLKPDRIRFEYGAAMISNIRIAVGAPDMRSKLITEGKLVSYGIYFDVNKDVVKPESYGTLKEIAKVLTENPDVKIKIVGHTDSDGADAANLDLSKRRGASVKNELVKTFGIDASRIESDGAGESQPVAPNDSPANKALNRRVEFIKL
ncbi:MAG: OmpA family protein [Bacteroidota bacterium]|nr:MAG: OmpA family protein [Bacteroidota bacterium]